MRRAEMARRRKNLSEKRNEEEKVRLVSFTDPNLIPKIPPPFSLTLHFFSPPFSITHPSIPPHPPLSRPP